jgi:hypothetical protein
MLWLLFVALFVIALAYALLLKVEDVAYTTPYRKELHAHAGNFDE